MNQEENEKLNERIWSSLTSDMKFLDRWSTERPILAHYTSLDALEKILTSEEIWFSHPVLMNDHQEMVFGLDHGVERLITNDGLSSALGESRRDIFFGALDHYYQQYIQTHAFDTYVFCLTEQERDDKDGVLSMWRGYGGNGKGCAIVFDTAQIGDVTKDSPIGIVPVEYLSNDDRLLRIDKIGQGVTGFLSPSGVSDDQMYLLAYAAFEMIKLNALSTKHTGFKEEREWRLVYQPERDEKGLLKPMLGYVNGPRGVETKLRLPIKHIPGVTDKDLSLSKLIHSILLGPNAATPLAVRAVQRMLRSEAVNKSELSDHVVGSSIPYRPL